MTVFDPSDGLVGLRGPEIAWGYRTTDLPKRGIVVEAVLRVVERDAVGIRRSMEASLRRRKRTQPLGMPSAGSVFVNPEGDSAGRLIEAAGLKGARVGELSCPTCTATSSSRGGATAADVISLIRLVRDAVRDSNGIELRPEIRFLGTFLES